MVLKSLKLSKNIFERTKMSILSISLLNEIFISFYVLIPFILRKDLLATTFQISLLTLGNLHVHH